MKIISKLLLSSIFIIIMFIAYLSIFGVETERFNDKIINKVKSFDKNLDIQLKTIKIVLDPLSFGINAKTIGSKLINKNKKVFKIRVLLEKLFKIKN